MSTYVALVVRTSRDKAGRKVNVKEQIKWGREYAARTWPGMPIEVFEDNNRSAAEGAKRSNTEFERFREWILAGRIGQVWVNEQSRLSRSERGDDSWFDLAGDLHAAGITHMHTNDHGVVEVLGDLAGIQAVLNAGELRRLKKRLRDHLQENAENGVPNGGTIFGYDHHDEHDKPYLLADGTKTMRIVPEQAAAIRWAAEKVLAGWSLSNIAAELRKQGLRGSHGGKIGVSAVRSMVTNPAVSGRRVHKGIDVGKGNWEPVLDEATRRACEAKLNGNRIVRRKDGGDYEIGDAHRGNPAGRKYLLTGGLSVCGVCDIPHPMTGQVTSRKKGVRGVPYLLCMPKGRVAIKMAEVDDYVVNEMLDRLDDEEFREQYAADHYSAERDAINAELVAVARKRAELAELWNLPKGHPDAMDSDEYKVARRIQAKREQELLAKLAAVPAPPTGMDISEIRAAWPLDMTLDEKRETIRTYVKRVTVKRAVRGQGVDSRVDIDWADR